MDQKEQLHAQDSTLRISTSPRIPKIRHTKDGSMKGSPTKGSSSPRKTDRHSHSGTDGRPKKGTTFQ